MGAEAYACFLFGGLVLFFMGIGLALDAEAHARSLLSWQPESSHGRLVWGYRLGGLFFVVFGAGILIGLLCYPQSLTAYFKPVRLGFAGRLIGGLFFSLAGMAMTLLRTSERPGLRGDLNPARRAAFWSGWMLILSFIVFGAFLLSRLAAARH